MCREVAHQRRLHGGPSEQGQGGHTAAPSRQTSTLPFPASHTTACRSRPASWPNCACNTSIDNSLSGTRITSLHFALLPGIQAVLRGKCTCSQPVSHWSHWSTFFKESCQPGSSRLSIRGTTGETMAADAAMYTDSKSLVEGKGSIMGVLSFADRPTWQLRTSTD